MAGPTTLIEALGELDLHKQVLVATQKRLERFEQLQKEARAIWDGEQWRMTVKTTKNGEASEAMLPVSVVARGSVVQVEGSEHG